MNVRAYGWMGNFSMWVFLILNCVLYIQSRYDARRMYYYSIIMALVECIHNIRMIIVYDRMERYSILHCILI